MAEPPWILKHGLAVIGAMGLGLPRATVEQLVADVGQFHRDSALAVLLRLNLALTHHTPLSQEEILRNWLPDVANRFLAVMREQKVEVVFYEAQVLNLIRLVILHAPADGGRRCDQKGDITLLARILLQITDMLVERDAKAEPDRRAWVFGNFTRTELFTHDEPRVPDAMARNYDLFVLVPRLLNRRGHTYDLPGTFAKITGLAIEDYIGLGFGLLSQYDTIDAGLIGHADIGIDRSTYLANVRLAAEVRDRLWPLVSKPLDEYQAALRREWERTSGAARWSAMTTFSQFPMIELLNGPVVAVSRRLLRDRVTHGIYWILANNLPGRERDDFTNFFGHVFEAYYEEIIHKGGRLKGRMIKPVTLLTTRDVDSIEGIMWDGGAWPDLLTRKHTERHVDDSFHNYVYRAFDGEIPRNEYLRVRWHRIGDMIGTRLFGETLDHSANAGPKRRPRRRRR